jgi:hypothetical protein
MLNSSNTTLRIREAIRLENVLPTALTKPASGEANSHSPAKLASAVRARFGRVGLPLTVADLTVAVMMSGLPASTRGSSAAAACRSGRVDTERARARMTEPARVGARVACDEPRRVSCGEHVRVALGGLRSRTMSGIPDACQALYGGSGASAYLSSVPAGP